MKMKRWGLLAVLAVGLAAGGTAPAESAKEVAQRAFRSVVLLVMKDPHGQPLSLGSGFFVRADIVATNFHVIEGASGGYARIVGQKTNYDIVGHVGVDVRRDLALVKVGVTGLPYAKLGSTKGVRVGDEVYAIGVPHGLEGTVTRGVVSAIKESQGIALIQTDAAINPGNSGGPLIHAKTGLVIGINTVTFSKSVAEGLSFAIAAEELKRSFGTTFMGPADASKGSSQERK